MFIKKLEVKNFKCFNDRLAPIEFNAPNGITLGSGLNILVGENNTGKSTIFESIDFLRNNTSKNLKDIKNKQAGIEDEMYVELTFSGDITNNIDNFSQENKKDVFKKYIYKNNADVECIKLSRSSKDIKTIKLWDNSTSKYKNEVGIDAPLKKLFEANFVWSDTNPNTQASFGATTICGNLLKEIINKFEDTDEYKDFSKQFNKTFNSEECGLKKELQAIEQKTQKIFSEQFGDAKISFHFDELKVDSFFKNTKIEIDDGEPTYMEEKGSGMQRSVALSLLQVYANELIKHPENGASKPFFLFIDEPEICLHPRAQIKLFNAILELSKTKQIFIATHSPYFFKNELLKNVGLFLFTKDGEHKILSINKNWGIFPWSPSWGEINYYAYNLPTVEFHNELYGYIHEQSKKNISEFDKYLREEKGITNCRGYNRDGHPKESITLPTYIRNQIHHPENALNVKYTDDELKMSIDLLIPLAK